MIFATVISCTLHSETTTYEHIGGLTNETTSNAHDYGKPQQPSHFRLHPYLPQRLSHMRPYLFDLTADLAALELLQSLPQRVELAPLG